MRGHTDADAAWKRALPRVAVVAGCSAEGGRDFSSTIEAFVELAFVADVTHVVMRTGWTPSIVPKDIDQDVYLVVDDLGRAGRVYREVDVGQTIS